jgi:hypothetical protein
VLSGRGLCEELITHPEESYRLCCVAVCDLETSRICATYIYDISHLRVKQQTGVRVPYATFSHLLPGKFQFSLWFTAKLSLNKYLAFSKPVILLGYTGKCDKTELLLLFGTGIFHTLK